MMAKSADRATASTRLALTCFQQKYRIKRDIEEKQLQIIEIEARMSGLYHQGLRLTPQQARSGLPMPHTSGPSDPTTKLLGLIEQKDELEKDIDYLTWSLRQAAKIEKLEDQDRRMVYDRFRKHKPVETICEQYGYTVEGFYKHIYGALNKVA